jgi:uncharacterized protein involved in high-affinity Fe2+ transport
MVLVAMVLLSLIMALSFASCGGGSDTSGDEPATTEEEAAAPADTAGFEEFPIGDDIEAGPLNIAGVYFQPVDMDPASGSLPKADSDMHIEADISALENNELGYGAGDFVPFLKVKYEILKEDGSKQTEGTFMPMNASDGPHYGANIKLGPAGKYKVKFIVENPTDAFDYLLHIDETTGVEGRFWEGELEAEWDFDYVPREW